MNAPQSANQLIDALKNPTPSLDDKYTQKEGRIYLNGSQALVRLMLLQAERDRINGLHTGGFVSGYRGSPLGAVDQAFWAAKKFLEPARIRFQPGLNEDLGATSVWGSQQVNLFEGATVDGVFGLWYGKGPGVDRAMDVFKHANAAGTSRHGGVLLVAGDDHGAKSSTLPHQSDHVLKAALMPVLFPSNTQEILDYGLLGYAMSRYCGAWVGFKAIADVVESSASVEVSAERPRIEIPQDFVLPATGLNIRWPDPALDQEARLLDYKLYAALAFARVNKINHTVIDSPHARFGIVASGKAYRDTLQALNDLGLNPQRCWDLGIRVYKVGMVWPLEAQGIREFARGLQEILVVEEKRQMLEYQIKEELYAWREDIRPKVYGKFDERSSADGREGGEWSIPQGRWLLPTHYELDPALIAKAIAHRLSRLDLPADVRHAMAQRIKHIRKREELSHPLLHPSTERKPYFCSGCPHNTSTRVPEGSRAMAGIGCHYMTVWMDRNTCTYTQMGGEGVPWIGQAPFTTTQHVFANLGDGTYFHSGILAIRASVSAGVNITYKLLYNDAVAMTGGQHIDGTLTVPQLTRQLDAEGVSHIVIVTDDVDKYSERDPSDAMAEGVPVYDRAELDLVQRQLREMPGTTVLVYEQTCASEKRRRRKRMHPETGQPLYPNPPKRVVINPRVCEGCGDCSSQSNCLSIEPLPTPWGIKRTINQSTCNKDYSCLQGLCPSLVTLEGADLREHTGQLTASLDASFTQELSNLPQPAGLELMHNREAPQSTYRILINGIGGTGVVTIGAWLGMAAHLEGLEVSVLDMAGLAQKGGAVFSHLQIAPRGQAIASPKIAVGEADLLIGGDKITSSHPKTLELLKEQAYVVLNIDTPPTADFIHNNTWTVPVTLLKNDLNRALKDSTTQLIEWNAQTWMEKLLGDTVYANAFLLGMAWQKGWVPLPEAALLKAIELNGVQVSKNTLAFQWGRLAAAQPEKVRQAQQSLWEGKGNGTGPQSQAVSGTHSGNLAESPVESPEQLLHRLHADLQAYQNTAYADAFLTKVQALRGTFENAGQLKLWTKLAQTYYRLLAFKDEFEVARLHTDTAWQQSTLEQFKAGARFVFHFAPVWLKQSGSQRPKKMAVSTGALPMLRLLAKMKFLRHTVFNPFKSSPEAINQREMVQLFETRLELMQNEVLAQSVTFEQIEASLNDFAAVKGYGQVRLQSFDLVKDRLRQSMQGASANHISAQSHG